MSAWNSKTKATAFGLLTLAAVACGRGQVELEQTAMPNPVPRTQGPAQNQAPRQPANTDADARSRARENALQTLQVRVHFDYDRAEIKPEFARVLDEKARVLRQYPNLRITVEGHCDERGSSEYNVALGNRRAEATKRYLVSQGIAESRIATVSYGKERPLIRTSNEQSWAQNRRAEFLALNPDAIAFEDPSSEATPVQLAGK